MKNFVQEGNKITIKAPYDAVSGKLVIKNSLYGVAIVDALQNEELTISTVGVYELDKDEQAIEQGSKAYYREDTKQLTPSASLKEGENEVLHQLVGIFVLDAKEDDKKARVKLAQIPT